MEENKEEPKKEKLKINFFKKIWYSIGKVSKYDEMAELGVKKAIKYFLGVIAIVTIVLAIVAVAVEASRGNIDTNLYAYYAIIYFLAYYIILFINFAIYAILISACLFLVFKLFKTNGTFRKILSMTIYATTLSVLVYVIYLLISYFSGFSIPYFDAISIIIVYIYLYIYLRRKRKENGNEFYRGSKKKSKK